MRTDSRMFLLDHLGLLRFSGRDARQFIQGQLSNDMAALQPGRLLLAGFHNPQGRVIALLRLAPVGDEAVIAIVHRELVAQVAARLRRFVLRSRVAIDDLTADTRVHGVAGGDTTDPAVLGAAPPDGVRVVQATDGGLQRAYVLQSLDQTALSPPTVMADARQWQTMEVAAAIPEVVSATSELFVAQMLNLDCLDGISFDKGCYTGQEIIARAHFRGRVKRRMQLFETDAARLLQPGEQLLLEDGRSATVVSCGDPVAGRRRFLAVAALPAAAGEDLASTPIAARLRSRQLPTPYRLPD
jgi:folate-binding protein YgfZ